ncbi:MAG: hypothetical protein NTW56_09310 [Alphaproteobacteria bacterium]|nr:hypothetical protein [Alphaproteobacteria bacterium]
MGDRAQISIADAMHKPVHLRIGAHAQIVAVFGHAVQQEILALMVDARDIRPARIIRQVTGLAVARG